MKKLFYSVGAILVLAIVASLAWAHGSLYQERRTAGFEGGFGMMQGMHGKGGMHGSMMGAMGQYHEQMEEIMEEGTYQDLVDLREEIGFDIMPFVDDEESFQEMKEHHELMEETGGCPMMNGFDDDDEE